MNFWVFAIVVIIVFLVLLQYLNIKRDSFFKATASRYGLQYQKLPMPTAMKSKEAYPVRKLEGIVRSHQVIVEDTVASTIPTLSLFANLLPIPLFGQAGWSVVRTKFFIDGQEKVGVYLKEGDYLASKKSIASFLENIS